MALFAILMASLILNVPAIGDDAGYQMPAATLSSPITVDGLFDDWSDMPGVTDRQGDAAPDHDIVRAKWYPDMSSSRMYMFCERLDGLTGKNNKPVDWDFFVYFDNASEKVSAHIHYHPESEQVDVNLYDESGNMIWRSKGKWGEDKYSADKVEFYVPISYIAGGVESGFQTDFHLESGLDRVPDNGYITISTAGTFPWFTGLMVLVWVALLVFLHKQKMHFYKFLAGSVGVFVFVMLLGSSIGEEILEKAVSWGMWALSGIMDGFSVLPSNSMVTVNHGQQAVSFIIDYECSGFIEILVYLSILLFYPLLSWWKKLMYAALGCLFIYAANLTRLLLISYSIRLFGTTVFFLSHTVFARILFFGLMVLLYYYVFTRMHIRKQRVGDIAYDR